MFQTTIPVTYSFLVSASTIQLCCWPTYVYRVVPALQGLHVSEHHRDPRRLRDVCSTCFFCGKGVGNHFWCFSKASWTCSKVFALLFLFNKNMFHTVKDIKFPEKKHVETFLWSLDLYLTVVLRGAPTKTGETGKLSLPRCPWYQIFKTLWLRKWRETYQGAHDVANAPAFTLW